MRIIWDASNHNLYPIGSEGFTSGTVQMIREISKGLAEQGHMIHIITNDLKQEEQKGPNLWFWPKEYHPTNADVAIQLMHVNPQPDYDADILLLATFGIDPYLGPDHSWAKKVDGFPVLSGEHGRLLRKTRPTIEESKCFVTGLGIDLNDYDLAMNDEGRSIVVPGRMLYSNDPSRGLFDVLDIFDKVREEVPEASLHITYDFDRNLEVHKWTHSHMAQILLECKERIEHTPGVVNLGSLSRQDIIREQLECQVHCMPSTAGNDQMHGLSQLECAAAGAALVLSDVAAFPEVFGEGASILPQVGKYIPALERRITASDYAIIVVDLMQNPDEWAKASGKARALAEANTWSRCIDRWETMLSKLVEVPNAQPV